MCAHLHKPDAGPKPPAAVGESGLINLVPHPSAPCEVVEAIEVAVQRHASVFRLRYRLSGDLAALAIPAETEPASRDGLWSRTCFEGFLQRADRSYAELNFSPSREYAGYAFSGYRTGSGPLDIFPPRIDVCRSEGLLLLTAIVSLPDALDFVRAGLSAVVEEADGTKSWWALAHPAAKPDFHHPDSFVHELP